MKVFAVFVAGSIVLSFLINLFRLARTNYYYRLFRGQDSYLRYCEESVSRLFNLAGVNNRHSLSLYKNLPVSRFLLDPSSHAQIEDTFCAAIGVYRFRMINAINPISIFERPLLIIRHFSHKEYSAARPSGVKSSAISAVLWLLGIVAAHYIEVFLESDAFRSILEACRSILK